MTAKIRAFGLAWFRREDYQRIRDISDDAMIPTFEQWEAKMKKLIASQSSPGIIFEKVMIDPDDLLAFAKRTSGGKINSQVRGQFAADAIMKKHSANH